MPRRQGEPLACRIPSRFPADLDRAVYVAVADARDDTEVDILAGIAHHAAVRQPDISSADRLGVINEIQPLVNGHASLRIERQGAEPAPMSSDKCVCHFIHSNRNCRRMSSTRCR